jgi:CheY-like chemotaxis protein
VKLQSIALTANDAQRIGGLQPGRFACLSVTDDGKGMDAATLAKIFEPFFTTKEAGKGTGLGLSVVHGIMQSHNGAITVDSQPGKGTTFRMYFPAASAPAQSAPEAASGPQEGRGEHVLYLDDEEPLVFLATRMLERLGYRISGFTSASHALEAFREAPAKFDLAVTDMNMPGASGVEFAAELLKVRADLPIVLCSGYVTDELRDAARKAGIRDVLYKPSTMEEFSEAIQRLAASA